MSSREENINLILQIIRINPGCTRTDIGNHLSYHLTDLDEQITDELLELMVRDHSIQYTKGRYFLSVLLEELTESVSSGLPGGRIPFAIRIRGHFLWTPEKYSLENFRDALHSLRNEYTSIDADLVPESDTQLRIKFALLDSTMRELAYSSGMIDSESFFVLTTVGFTRAIPKFLIEAMNDSNPDLEPITELLPLYSIVYISLHMLELALHKMDQQAVLAVDDFTIVNIRKE